MTEVKERCVVCECPESSECLTYFRRRTSWTIPISRERKLMYLMPCEYNELIKSKSFICASCDLVFHQWNEENKCFYCEKRGATNKCCDCGRYLCEVCCNRKKEMFQCIKADWFASFCTEEII